MKQAYQILLTKGRWTRFGNKLSQAQEHKKDPLLTSMRDYVQEIYATSANTDIFERSVLTFINTLGTTLGNGCNYSSVSLNEIKDWDSFARFMDLLDSAFPIL